MLRPAIICDIDGVLLAIDNFEKENVNLSKQEYLDKFEKFCDKLPKNYKMFDLLNLFYIYTNYEIILLSARSKRIAEKTIQYLTEGFPCLTRDMVCMFRPLDQEGVADSIVKQQMVDKLKESYSIILAIDDKKENCAMYSKNGIMALQVKENWEE